MQYRSFGRDNYPVSILGFGTMRLPLKPESKTVDVGRAIEQIRYGIDCGINYIDTAYFYHDGLSEGIVAKALRDGYREKVRVATKSPGHLIQTADDFDRILDEQLARLETDSVDYYLFHGIGSRGLNQIQELGLFEKMEQAKKAGKIGHIGFSFHDGPDAFRAIVNSYDGWEFCQIQYNYMDTMNQAGTAGLQYATEHGISVVVMEPLLGGRLARPPENVQKIFDASGKRWSPAAWALQWIWKHPEVAMVLSGMNTIEQIDENCAIADRSIPGSFTDADAQVVEAVQTAFHERTLIPCTACGYCMPCPSGVDIPRNLGMYNEGMKYGDPGAPRFVYNNFFNHEERADRCTGCGVCEETCPQKIPISSWMPKVHAVLGDMQPYNETI